MTGLGEVTGAHVLVADEMGRADAMLLADALHAAGRRVSLATSCLHVGEDEGITTLYPLLRRLGQLGVDLRERVRVTAFEGAASRPREPVGRPRRRRSRASTRSCTGRARRAAVALPAPLRAAGVDVHVIGDARLPRRVDVAVLEAAELAWSLGVEPVAPR